MKQLLFALAFLFLPLRVHAELNLELPDLNLPDLGRSVSSFGSSVNSKSKGLKTLRKFRGSNQVIEDPEINLWIRSLGNKLMAAAPRSSSPIYFLVSKESSINAFATQGGVIVVNAGLILQTKTESELAAVIAHEIAHVTQHHIERMINNANENKLATNAALIAGIIASSKDPQAGQAIISGSIAAMAHQQLSFSREAETEADRVGLRILVRAGFNPKGMPNFLSKLEQFSDDRNANVLEYIQSHPLTSKRVADTQTRARQFGVFRGKDNIRYLYMREKIRATSDINKAPPKNTPVSLKPFVKALKLQHEGNYLKAVSLMKGRRSTTEAILTAQLYNRLRQYQQTIQLLAPLTEIYPEDEALSIPLARAYIATSNINSAWNILNEVNYSEQTSLEYFEVLQEIARLAGRTANAYYAAANRNIRIGAYKAAAAQLRRAIKSSNSNNKLHEMQQQLTLVEALINKN